MSQRKLKKAIEEQKSATIDGISNVANEKIDVQMLTYWSELNGNQWHTKDYCKLIAIEKLIKEHESKVNHLKKKYND